MYGESREEILRMLENDGRGENWMKQLQDKRKERKGKGMEIDEDGRLWTSVDRRQWTDMNKWVESAGEDEKDCRVDGACGKIEI